MLRSSFPFTKLVVLLVIFILLTQPFWRKFGPKSIDSKVHGRFEAVSPWPTLSAGDHSRHQKNQPPRRRCAGPGGIISDDIKSYSLPKSHPTPTLGATDLFPGYVCTTYNGRYGIYTDEALHLEAISDRSDVKSNPDWKAAMDSCSMQKTRVIVLRCYESFRWTTDDVLNVRALISELALDPDSSYTVRILLDSHSRGLAFQTSARGRAALLQRSVPREFWSMVTIWDEDQMANLYPSLPVTQGLLNHMIPQSSYRSCFMPLQKFALDHPEYDNFWNWELDVRSTFDYRTVIEAIDTRARTKSSEKGVPASQWVPAGVEGSKDDDGQEADFITLNPIFDVKGSGWYWSYDVQNYPEEQETARKASIGTTVRFSRRLLLQMNDINADDKRSMMCTAFPPTIALHSRSSDERWRQMYSSPRPDPPLKAIYVRHPIYFGHRWDMSHLLDALSKPNLYAKANEKVLRDASFYYDGAHALTIYEGWRESNSSVCRAPSLLHPIKSFHFNDATIV